MSPQARPPRTALHADRDALIRQFKATGLTPRLGVNGSNPHADIEIGFDKTIRPGGGVTSVTLTEAGAARLEAAGGTRE